MITRRTRIQLLIFAIITLLGVSYTGARYAQLDQLVLDQKYAVTVHLAQSGGIFAQAEVTYRGVTVGEVERLELTDRGVDAVLSIRDDYDQIPRDTFALVANRSAVGEQYVELQPQANSGPYLQEGSEVPVENTETPLPTEELLANLARTVNSVDRQALKTTIDELGKAFAGSGRDLQRIIDTGNSFLETADENFEVTRKLIRDGNTVLDGQLASESSLRTFADQLSKFSQTLVEADPDLRKVINEGPGAAAQLRALIEENRVQLGQLLNNLVTTGEIVVKRLEGIQQILVLYPYAIEGGFTVASRTPETGLVDAHFGAVITDQPVCTRGYGSTNRRNPETERGNAPMNTEARCTEPPEESNARGVQNLPPNPRAGASYRGSPVIATWDRATGEVEWTGPAAAGKPGTGEPGAELSQPGSVAAPSSGEESWQWLYAKPMMTR